MKSKLGQNFLIDKNIADFEVKIANITKEDTVLEIGPGKGVLTDILTKRAKKVIGVEIDKKLYENLRNNAQENLLLINKDVLKLDFNSIPNFNKVVSNIPYQISSPLTFKILEFDIDLAVLIYQKEFAERLIAQPFSKNYSRLTVNVFYKAECELIKYVPRTCFCPQPKIDSAIVKIIPRKNPAFEVHNEDLFKRVTKSLFNHRRKKIKTVIKQKYTKEIQSLPFLDSRVEELTPREIAILSNKLNKIIN